jgi:hypothetical protein
LGLRRFYAILAYRKGFHKSEIGIDLVKKAGTSRIDSSKVSALIICIRAGIYMQSASVIALYMVYVFVHPFIIAIPQKTVALFSLNASANFLIMFIMIVYLIFISVALSVYI